MSNSRLEPINTEWNRKANMLSGKGNGVLLGIKHGTAYFTWTDLDNTVFYMQCDELVLNKHFRVSLPKADEAPMPGAMVLEDLLAKKARFLKYPFDVVGK